MSLKAAVLHITGKAHASVGHFPCLYAHACEQRQINYCRVGKRQDKMTWPHFDSLISMLPPSNPYHLISAHLNHFQSERPGKTEVRSWLWADSYILVI